MSPSTSKSPKSQSGSASHAAAATGPVSVLVATRKGGFILRGDAARRSFKVSPPIFLGHVIHHIVADPRDRKTVLMAARTGHLGPTVFRSKDSGKTWKE